ncbi:hypothetical protein SK128_014160 [Halocaridina rubra]|uniref:Uncharacterized protein n=1 Tax=Halocaridina rubra TaxID=373956 RepID=A0AAN8XNQ5_HALRR
MEKNGLWIGQLGAIIFLLSGKKVERSNIKMCGMRRYPQVVYSMLRQSEDESEDVLGEILINIGLADPEDARPLTPSSSETSESPQPSEQEMNISDFDGTKFTTIPLRSDEVTKRLMDPEPEESDEELLQ